MFKTRLLAAIAVATILFTFSTSTPADARVKHRSRHARISKPLYACQQSPKYVAAMRFPCSEIDRAISVAALEWGYPEVKLRTIVACESTFQPFVRNGSHVGLIQAGVPFWNNHVAEFNAIDDPEHPHVGGDRTNPFDSARVGAMTMSRHGQGEWSCKA